MSLSLKARKNLYLVHMNDRPHLTPASSPLTNSTNGQAGRNPALKAEFTLLLGKSTSSLLAKESSYHL